MTAIDYIRIAAALGGFYAIAVIIIKMVKTHTIELDLGEDAEFDEEMAE